MGRYVLRRLVMLPPLLVAGAALVFFMLRVVPGDPVRAALGTEATEEEVEALRQALGWNDPLPVQFVRWLGDLARGDLGESLVSRQSVSGQLAERLPPTVEVLVLAMLLSTTLGVSFGVISAVYRNSFLDHLVRIGSVAALSVPAFFALTLLIVLPSQWWNYVPPLTYEPIWEDPVTNLRMFVPPVLILSVEMSASLMRYTRSVSLDVLQQDYIRTARAKGLRERKVVINHMLKNTSIPVVTILGARFAGLLGGTVILEQVMSIQGIGQFAYQSVKSKDYSVVQSLTVYFGLLVILSHLIVDISYAMLDPRIRYR